MSLQFIIGGAGSGKSTYLHRFVTEEAEKDPQGQFFVVVPEQFTLHTQQELVACSPRGSILNIDVVSFDRLAYRIFDELGINTHQLLDDTGKYLLLSHVALRHTEELTVLAQNVKRPGTVTQLKSLFSEFMQYALTPEDLEEIAREHKGAASFFAKASDLSILYDDYIKTLSDTYITSEEVLPLLITVANRSKLLRDAVIVFDGFTGFTPVQYQFMQQILALAGRVVVAMDCDPEISLYGDVAEEELFSMSRTMAQKLSHLAEAAQTEVLAPVYLRENHRFVKDGMLAHMEQHLFRTSRAPFSSEEPCEDAIRLVCLPDIRTELTWIGCEILRQVRAEGYHFSDFAIACADFENYSYLIPGIFDTLGIPYFLDASSAIEFHPFLECLSSLFMVFEERYSYESVMRLLRTKMLGFSDAEIDAFENYILVMHLHGVKQYHTPFSEVFYVPDGYTDEDIARLDDVRRRLVEPMDQFLAVLSQKHRGTVTQITTALYEWIVSYDMEAQLYAESKRFSEQGFERKAREYEQVYKLVMDLLDQMVTLLGDEMDTFSDYAKLLSSGMESLAVGMLPESSDVVMIGDMERTRLADISILYLAGAADGAIPSSAGNGGLLSEHERRALKEQGYELAPTEREKSFFQRFYLYFVMTQPKRELCISYARTGSDGKPSLRSYLFGTMESLFPGLSLQMVGHIDFEQQLYTPSLAAASLAEALCRYADGREELLDPYPVLLASNRDWKEEFLQAAFYVHQPNHISSVMVDRLFGETIYESVSRIEQYHRCAYAFFLKYGLALEKRPEYQFENLDEGSLYHDVLDIYAKEVTNREDLDWMAITADERQEVLRQSIVKAYTHVAQKQIMNTPREEFLFYRVERTLERTVWAITEQVQRGRFVPSHFEVQLDEVSDEASLSYQLDAMHALKLRGKIDRIDTYEQEDTVYVKIVDYKSSDKKIDLNELYGGLQIQLILYMGATIDGMKKKTGKQVEPAALFYSHIYHPILDDANTRGKTEDEIEEAFFNEYRSKGYVIADNADEIIRISHVLDTKFSGKSDSIPITIKKDGDLASKSTTLTTDEFAELNQYVQTLVRTTGEQMAAGEFDARPFDYNKRQGCTYCDYRGICGFDRRLEGFSFRKLEKEKSDEVVLAKIRQINESEEEDDAKLDRGTTEGH